MISFDTSSTTSITWKTNTTGTVRVHHFPSVIAASQDAKVRENLFKRVFRWCRNKGKNLFRKHHAPSQSPTNRVLLPQQSVFAGSSKGYEAGSEDEPFVFPEETGKRLTKKERKVKPEFEFVGKLDSGYYGCVAVEQVKVTQLIRSKSYGTGDARWKQVAIKRPREERVSSIESFMDETYLLDQLYQADPELAKRFIPKTYIADEEMLVMKLCNRGSMAQFRSSGEWKSLSVFDRLQVMAKAAECCAFLEAMRVVHNDIAARNFLLHKNPSEEWKVYITDFGLSEYLDNRGKVFHQELRGDITHMSPEKTLGFVSTKSDSWAFGMFLIEMVIGPGAFYRLMDRSSKNIAQFIRTRESGDFCTSFVKVSSDKIHPNLIRIIEKATEPNPRKRSSLRKIADKLHDLCD